MSLGLDRISLIPATLNMNYHLRSHVVPRSSDHSIRSIRSASTKTAVRNFQACRLRQVGRANHDIKMSSGRYDEDAQVVDSISDLESESESDTLIQSPSSKDHETLNEYDEAEQLLSEDAPLSTLKARTKNGREARRERSDKRNHVRNRRRSSGALGEASNQVYEMEEGFKDTSSNSSTDSLLLKATKKTTTSRSLYCRWLFMAISITLLFIVLAYGAYRASHFISSSTYVTQTMSNGTHLFEATTILISLDGFRADFLQRGLTPSLNAFVASGVSPQYMLPSFPSVTFPNHYTLVTGLYPESHGIVGNQFWDPEFQEEFYYTNTTISMQSKWWDKAEPIWETAERQGMKTAVHMWPGSEAHIHGIDPTYLDTYKPFEPLRNKADRMLEWLDMERKDRPQLIAAYVPDVDRDGHKYGPNSTQIHATIASADNMLTLLIEGLLQRNLTEIVNLVVVSDHGMATMSAHRMVQLDDIIDMTLVDHLDGWPLRGLRLRNPERDVPIMYKQLSEAAKQHGTFDVYTLDTMPQRYHFANNPRIAPLWVVPKTGWLVIERENFDIAEAIATGTEYNPIGIHGFDHEHPLMRAIFIARGPAFPHAPNSRLSVFQNIEVYNIVCDSLGIAPHNSNGTLHLPLKTEGLHSGFEGDLKLPNDDPADIAVDESKNEPSTVHHDNDHDQSDGEATADVGTASPETAPTTQHSKWWVYLHDQLEKAKNWAKQIMESVKNNHADSDNKAG